MDLHTKYMGIDLQSPIVVASCPLSEKINNIKVMEKVGAGAVVLFSLFEEQIEMEDESIDIDPHSQHRFKYRVGIHQYLDVIKQAKDLVDIPIIASLNGTADGKWIDYAEKIAASGADGLELNLFYLSVDPQEQAYDIEAKYLNIINHIRKTINIPLSIKLSPYFSALPNMALKLAQAGVDSLVLFNRFYQPDINIEDLTVIPSLELSSASEIRLPLLWISALYDKIDVSLAATTGIDSSVEIIKYILAGADVTMTASALYKYGINHVQILTEGIRHWMELHGFSTLADFRGMLSQKNIKDPFDFERLNYIRILENAAIHV